jgi:hypothetical protein
MGFISYALGQMAVTSVVLGSLKRHGIATLHLESIESSSVRTAVTTAVSGNASHRTVLGSELAVIVCAARLALAPRWALEKL